MATALAVWLRRIGLAPGDPVALMIRNSPVALALLFAIARARAVWVPINVQGRGENLRCIIEHSNPKLVIAEPELHATLAESGTKRAATQFVSMSLVEEIARGSSAA